SSHRTRRLRTTRSCRTARSPRWWRRAVRSSGCALARGGIEVPGHPLQHLGPELAFAFELAEHADAGRGHAVDEHVRRRHVELAADVAGAHVRDARGLPAQPFAAELERVHL